MTLHCPASSFLSKECGIASAPSAAAISCSCTRGPMCGTCSCSHPSDIVSHWPTNDCACHLLACVRKGHTLPQPRTGDALPPARAALSPPILTQTYRAAFALQRVADRFLTYYSAAACAQPPMLELSVCGRSRAAAGAPAACHWSSASQLNQRLARQARGSGSHRHGRRRRLSLPMCGMPSPV